MGSLSNLPGSALPPRLLKTVSDASQLKYMLPAPPVLERAWVIRNPYSEVFRLHMRCGQWTGRFYAKVPSSRKLASAALAARLQSEYEILKELFATQTQDSQGGVVEPLLCDPSIPCLVTVDADGAPLNKLYAWRARVISPPRARSHTERIVWNSGRWLLQFHRQSISDHGPFDTEALIEYCASRLDTLAVELPGVLSRQLADRLLSSAATLARTLPRSGVQTSYRHNDFASHNIIARPDGSVRILDFTMLDLGSTAYDVCNFWLELELLKCDPTYARRHLASLQQTFLDGYGAVSPALAEFRLARLRYSINRLLRLTGPTVSHLPFSPYRHACRTHLLRWLHQFGTEAA